MSKAVRVAAAISVPTFSSNQFDYNQLVPVALFSGIGLLISLLAILSDMPIAWH
jgi:hypothetical protein